MITLNIYTKNPKEMTDSCTRETKEECEQWARDHFYLKSALSDSWPHYQPDDFILEWITGATEAA